MKTVRICIGYELDGKNLDDMPAASADAAKVKCVYQDFPGWTENLEGIQNRSDLPSNAQLYLTAIEKFIKIPISIISVAAERTSTIFAKEIVGLEPFRE